ncbi:MAG: CvpA family protein [Elusimicrobiota bacterium]
MNPVDLIILLSIVFFGWLGSRIGILITISSVLSGIFGFIIANLFYIKFAVFLPPKPSNLIISYFLIFFSISVLVFYIGVAISKLMHLMFFGLVDKFLGALVGIAFGCIICGAMLFVAGMTASVKIKQCIKNSNIAPIITNKIITIIKPFSKTNYKISAKDITIDAVKRVKSISSSLK